MGMRNDKIIAYKKQWFTIFTPYITHEYLTGRLPIAGTSLVSNIPSLQQ
jgi:hypothetical protein